MVTGPDSLYVTLLILLHSLTSESVKFEVLGPSEPIVAVAGDDIILPCYLKPNISVEDMTVDWLNLDFIDERVYRYEKGRIIFEDQIPFYRRRTSLFKEELWRGNTSLKLTRVQGTDEGRYKCFVKSHDWYDDVTIQVLVKAVGSKLVLSIEGRKHGEMGLVCQSEGWHPEPDLVWLDSKGVKLSAGPPEIKREFEGSYTVKQHVIVQETDTNLFTCRVLQTRINEEVETEVHIPSELFDYTIPWKNYFIVLSSLGVITVIGLILAVYWIHRKKGVLHGQLKQQLDYVKEKDVIILQLQQHQGYVLKKDFDAIRKNAVDVTLDPDTAHPQLILSEDGKRVRCGDKHQDVLDITERFNYYAYVLGKKGFSGRFYYEVLVKAKTDWSVGVARESVDRKEGFTVSPDKGYWVLWLYNGVYMPCTDPRVNLSLREKPQKVGVFVDYEEGQVSFFNVEARCHIYSFTGQTFNKNKLYPVFSPGLNYDVSNSDPLFICSVQDTY